MTDGDLDAALKRRSSTVMPAFVHDCANVRSRLCQRSSTVVQAFISTSGVHGPSKQEQILFDMAQGGLSPGFGPVRNDSGGEWNDMPQDQSQRRRTGASAPHEACRPTRSLSAPHKKCRPQRLVLKA